MWQIYHGKCNVIQVAGKRGCPFSAEDDLWQKTSFDARRPLMEDNLWCKTTFDEDDLCQKQGGIKFEISWEPNFPVSNFARNNGKKSRHHLDNNQRKVVTNDNTGQKFTVFWSLGRLLGVSHFHDKCAGYTIKISCESLRFRGNLVPRFPVIIPPWLSLAKDSICLLSPPHLSVKSRGNPKLSHH